MFSFIVKHFGFLKSIPFVALIFDSQLKLLMLITGSAIPDYLDQIEAEVLTWTGATATLHKYGGIQFNYNGTEIGHIHSNGLLDMLFDRKTKEQLFVDGKIEHHHTFINSGWISFYIKTQEDKENAIRLLRVAYSKS
jgi:hypothetical protein